MSSLIVRPALQAAVSRLRQFLHPRYRPIPKSPHGPLPEDTYRILDQGTFLGHYYTLELMDHPAGGVVLRQGEESPFALHGQWEQAQAIARRYLAATQDAETADRATFERQVPHS